MIYWLILLIGNVVFWFGSFRDYLSSLKQTTHGAKEGVTGGLFGKINLNKDKYGYFSAKRFWIARGVFWTAFSALALAFFAFDDGAKNPPEISLAIIGALFIVVGGVSIFRASTNNAKAELSRKRDQIPVLEQLSVIPTFDMSQITGTIRLDGTFTEGRARYDDFPWLYMDGMAKTEENIKRLSDAVFPILWQISRKPRSAWFSDTTMRRLN